MGMHVARQAKFTLTSLAGYVISKRPVFRVGINPIEYNQWPSLNKIKIVQSAGAIEYTDCFFAEVLDPPPTHTHTTELLEIELFWHLNCV